MKYDLIKGFAKFRQAAYAAKNSLMRRLARQGQSPDYFIISCIDSRGDPGSIFKAPAGTFFAHKAMGAIVRPYKKGTALSAALQFALNFNKVSTIIVLGHTSCGAVQALVEGLQDEEITSFVEVARAGLENAKQIAKHSDSPEALYRHTEEQIVLLSVENLKTYPSVQKALAEKRLDIKAWIFEMHEGGLLEYSPAHKVFIPVIDEKYSIEKKTA